MWKGRSCLQGPSCCSCFGELPHSETIKHMVRVTATILRAANPGSGRARHPGRRLWLACWWAKGSGSWAWAVKMSRVCLADSCRDRYQFLGSALGHPPRDSGKLLKCWCPSNCDECKGFSHYASTLDPEESLGVVLPWWELVALAAI